MRMAEGRRWVVLAVAVASLSAGCAAERADPPPVQGSGQLACGTPCGVTIATGRLWEPMVVVDPTDPLHLVASSQEKLDDPTTGRGSWALSHVSFDGGATWETHRLPGGRDAPPGHPLATTTWMDDSVPLFLPDGTLVWTVLAFEVVDRPPLAAVAGADLVALRSHDGGATFPDVTVVAEGGGADALLGSPVQGDRRRVPATHELHDKQWLALGDDGTLLLVWTQNLAARPDACAPSNVCTHLLFSTSTDGAAWTAPRTLVEHVVSGAFPLVLSDGSWLVSFHHTREQEVVVARSTDHGATWAQETLGESTKFPVMARSKTAAGERVHLAYPRGQDGRDGNQTVVVRWSDDGGATWSAEVAVETPDAPGRTIPAIAGAPGGGAYLTFWSPDAETAEFLAVHVRDGGVSAPLVLDAHDGPTSRTGDYMGLASLPDGGAFAVWTASEGDAMRLAGASLRFG